MNESLTLPALIKSCWLDFRRAWGNLVVFEILFQSFKAWLLVPGIAVLLAAVLAHGGHVAVSNRDILDFLLTPTGLLYAVLFGALAVVLWLLEQAGAMSLVALADSGTRPPPGRAIRVALAKSLRVGQLGTIQAGLLALACAPFALLAALTYWLLLTQHDIYYYLKDRPPTFWLAAGIGAALSLSALAAGLVLLVRWAFALPILLFENQPPIAALRASRDRIRGIGWQVGSLLAGWLLAAALLGIALAAGFRLFAATILDRTGEGSLAPILLLLIAQGALFAALSFVTTAGQVVITRRLYAARNEQLGIFPAGGGETIPDASAEMLSSPRARLPACLAATAILLGPLAAWASLPDQLSTQPPEVRVTAHRGHARRAPENTLAAIRAAIEVGADYAEIDVHRTADGVVVLLHDRDLKRVAGTSRRLDELTYEEARKLDVGSWFSPAFADERIPTLEEAIRLCRGRIRMNIEMKFFDPDRQLARNVARIVREQGFEPECLVTSLNADAIDEAKRLNPGLRTGLTVAHALGDISRLQVDALSIRVDFLSDDVLRAAHRLGREVHAWTVNDAAQMTRLIKRGVDNIITSDPEMAIRARDEWASLSDPERLIVASRLLLGLDP
jgi:glycerophosphoryl diester phosphodiesterase